MFFIYLFLMNICIIGYCHNADGFLGASNALQLLNYKVRLFPYLSYKMDKNINLIQDFHDFLKNYSIKICIWWNNSILKEDFDKMIKNNEELIHIFYNWDPFLYEYSKYTTNNWIKRIEDKKNIYRQMNYIFSCFGKEVSIIQEENINRNIFYNPPGFDKNISYYHEDEHYKCDVSIVATNLYEDNQEFPFDATNITRFEIVNYLYSIKSKIKFHVYGPPHFKERFGECYKGFVTYNNCKKIFSNSKINLSIHPIIYELNDSNCEKEYFSERIPQILGCKGLLITNSYLHHTLKPDKDYIHIDKENYKDKINHILNNSNDYENIRINGYNKALLYYQWNNWALKIHNFIS